ncbi:MAG: NAD-dependent dehydratase [Opitutae bacterium]|nr:NAD-dependent dehydratase [Opitutae bacterium]
MNEKRVFVTGSTGCIGAHAVSILLEEGYQVFGFNRNAPSVQFDGYQHLQGDLADPQSIESALKNANPSHILHLGALQTPDCRDYPIQGLDVNVLGTAYLFKACLKLKMPLERFVFASSSAVNGPRDLYGKDGVKPEDPLQPFNLYGYWKIAGEGMAQAYHQESGVPTVSLRLATTYGPGRDRGFTAAMTSALKAVAKGQRFEIPYRGKENYHFSHDVGAGFARAVIDSFSGYGVFNLLGQTRSVDEFLEIIKEQAARLGLNGFELLYTDGARTTPFIYDLNCSSTRDAFPQMPQTDLREGIRLSLEYFAKT